MSEGTPKSQQLYEQHREDSEKLKKAQRFGNATNLHEAVSDYHEHLEEAREAGDLSKHPELYDQAHKEMEDDKGYSSEAFSRGMPTLTPEQEKVVKQMKERKGFPALWDENRIQNIKEEFHLPNEVIQFMAKEAMIYSVKEGGLKRATWFKERYKIPDFEEYQILMEREERAKLALEEYYKGQKDERIIGGHSFNVIRNKGIDHINVLGTGKIKQAIEYIETHDTPMSVKISLQCPTNDTVQLLEKLDAVAAEKRVPIELRIMSDCVFDSKEVVAMELFTSKLWRSRTSTL